MPSPQWWPLDNVRVTGDWGNSPEFYEQFGQRGHNGVDMAAGIGTPVFATDEGIVLMEGWNLSWTGSIGGIAIILKHWWGYSGYAHLSSTVINYGQSVERGQHIGYSGNTGVGTGPHLHFETFPNVVNFNNGFAGRVNPDTLIDLQPRGTYEGAPAKKPEPQPEPEEEIMNTYHEAVDNSSPGKDGTSAVWAGERRLPDDKGPLYSSVFERREDGTIVRLLKDEWEQIKAAYAAAGRKVPFSQARGNVIEQMIVYSTRRYNPRP